MSTITFDTLEFTRKLRDTRLDEKQADAQNALVTREHFDAKIENLETRMDNRFALMDVKIDKQSWAKQWASLLLSPSPISPSNSFKPNPDAP